MEHDDEMDFERRSKRYRKSYLSALDELYKDRNDACGLNPAVVDERSGIQDMYLPKNK